MIPPCSYTNPFIAPLLSEGRTCRFFSGRSGCLLAPAVCDCRGAVLTITPTRDKIIHRCVWFFPRTNCVQTSMLATIMRPMIEIDRTMIVLTRTVGLVTRKLHRRPDSQRRHNLGDTVYLPPWMGPCHRIRLRTRTGPFVLPICTSYDLILVE